MHEGIMGLSRDVVNLAGLELYADLLACVREHRLGAARGPCGSWRCVMRLFEACSSILESFFIAKCYVPSRAFRWIALSDSHAT